MTFEDESLAFIRFPYRKSFRLFIVATIAAPWTPKSSLSRRSGAPQLLEVFLLFDDPRRHFIHG
jgi:hypothetical protein